MAEAQEPREVTSEELEADLRTSFRRLFNTQDGKKVLYTMLVTDLGLFREAKNEEEMVLRNYASFFVKDRLGLIKASDALAVIGEILKLGK